MKMSTTFVSMTVEDGRGGKIVFALEVTPFDSDDARMGAGEVTREVSLRDGKIVGCAPSKTQRDVSIDRIEGIDDLVENGEIARIGAAEFERLWNAARGHR